MKKCPFCREEIQDDAIKCRYCFSSLLPQQSEEPGREKVSAPGPDQTQYIVDNGLLRFGKFVAGALAIFIAVGAFIWGFDVKEASREARSALDEVNATQKKAAEIAESIDKREERIRKAMDSLDVKLALVSQEVDAIHQTRETADTFVRNFIARTISISSGSLTTGDGNANGRNGGNGSAGTSLILSEVMASYSFPKDLDGKGQTIALIELGGGFKDSDLKKYFDQLKLTPPDISIVSVDGGKNEPSSPAAEQVTFDLEVVGTIVPKAHFKVYITVNTDNGFVDAINAAIRQKVSVISIGWGLAESSWTSSALQKMENVFVAAAAAGITVVAAAGDQGATDAFGGTKLQVDFPASSPHVLACGGTKWSSSEEVVWNNGELGSTGGGFSAVFPIPDWQKGTISMFKGKTGRGIPDVSANADPTTGYQIVVGGKTVQIGGTIASAPVWAGLIAMVNQRIGRNVGFINPLLYQSIGPGKVLRDIIKGNNITRPGLGFEAGPGWDPCTGWGSPDVKKLLDFYVKQK